VTEASVPHSSAGRHLARALFLGARWHQWRGRPQRALQLCREAVRHADYPRADALMARLTLPGEIYYDVLARIHAHLRPATYLEIGIARGESLQRVLPDTDVIGIDPQPQLPEPASARQRIVTATSDEFFAQHDLRAEFGGRALDLAFIDGMHRFEYALRDFINVERWCAPHSVILMHDCYPLDARTSQREQRTRFWSGDIWRLLLLLREQRPDLTVRTIATPATGLGIVLNPNPASRLLAERHDQLVESYLAKDFSVLEGRKPEALGLLPNEWPAIRALLDARPPRAL
jgi:Methyltransferase domain